MFLQINHESAEVFLLHSGFYNLLYQNRVGSPGSIYTFYISKNSFFISASYLLGAVSVFMESRCVSVPFPQNQRSCAQFSAADCWFWSNFHPTSRCWNILQLEMHNIQQMETCCFCLELRFWFWREGGCSKPGCDGCQWRGSPTASMFCSTEPISMVVRALSSRLFVIHQTERTKVLKSGSPEQLLQNRTNVIQVDQLFPFSHRFRPIWSWFVFLHDKLTFCQMKTWRRLQIQIQNSWSVKEKPNCWNNEVKQKQSIIQPPFVSLTW